MPGRGTATQRDSGEPMTFYKRHAPNHREHQRALGDHSGFAGYRAQDLEAGLPTTQWDAECRRGQELGLPCADSIEDKTEISCFQRGELPHWSGINTFLKMPYLEDVRKVGDYDVAFVGAPFDIGTTYRSGTRFGPQAIRRISSLYTAYNFELGVDLRESLKMCDAGDIFCPANITLEVAWKGASAVFLSFDIDSVDAGFVPGTGWPEPGGFLPREALAILRGVAREGVAGMEVVEVSPPYDHSDITGLVTLSRGLVAA